MSRRKAIPSRLTLFDAPAGPPVPVDQPAVLPPEPVAPSYIKHGAFRMPCRPGEQTALQWFCVCDPSGAYRDALAILYAVVFRDGKPVAMSCPVLGQRWDAVRDYLYDCVGPFYSAAYAYAVRILELPEADVPPLCYFTTAHSTETRAEQRDVPHLGDVRPKVARKEVKAVATC